MTETSCSRREELPSQQNDTYLATGQVPVATEPTTHIFTLILDRVGLVFLKKDSIHFRKSPQIRVTTQKWLQRSDFLSKLKLHVSISSLDLSL